MTITMTALRADEGSLRNRLVARCSGARRQLGGAFSGGGVPGAVIGGS